MISNNTVLRDKLNTAKEGLSILYKQTRLVRCASTESNCRVKSSDGTSDLFKVDLHHNNDPLALISLKIIIHTAIVNHGGTIFIKITNTLAYADDVVITGRPLIIKEAFLKLYDKACNVGLHVNKKIPKF